MGITSAGGEGRPRAEIGIVLLLFEIRLFANGAAFFENVDSHALCNHGNLLTKHRSFALAGVGFNSKPACDGKFVGVVVATFVQLGN